MENSNTPAMSLGMQYQLQIYFKGAQGVLPKLPVSPDELEKAAEKVMKQNAFGYIAGCAGSESTATNNKTALDAWRIIPRMLTDVSKRDMSIELFGTRLPTPILYAPIGILSIAHPDAEVGVAHVAKELGIPQILSTVSANTLEEVGEANGDNLHWFQLYWGQDKEFTKSLIKRAEQAGYKAIVVTVDTRLLAWRERDIKNAYLPFVYYDGLANYLSDPVFMAALDGDAKKDHMKTLMQFAYSFSNDTTTWEDLREIIDCTDLPIIIKGIQHPDDAVLAIDHGASGIIVSNHGGRQVDGAIGAIEALPEIVRAVGDQTTIMFDSGIRRGADVFKAMALGAKAVLLGRPYAYALGIGGSEGVKEVTMNLLADIDLTMGLAGCANWNEVGPNMLKR